MFSKKMACRFFYSGIVSAVSAFSLPTALCHAEETSYEEKQLRFQSVYVWQRHSTFDERAPIIYSNSSRNDLPRGRGKSYTAAITAYAGFRPWAGGEAYLNLEVAQGMPFSENLVGMGGFYNGEITRVSGNTPKSYRQRLFLRQTWNFGGGTESIDPGFNWMAGSVDKNRFVMTAGNFSVLDVFGKNAYAGDARRQFLNWGHMGSLAYDYVADARGFSWGFAGEWYQNDWTLRFGRMAAPEIPNGSSIDSNLFKHYGDQIEIERRYHFSNQPGAVRLLAWRNKGKLATFRAATRYGDSVGWQSDPTNGMQYILNTRDSEKFKYGFGFNAEQAVSANLGIFFKGMWSDGRTETQAFAEADRSLSAGISADGTAWGRAQDTFGISLMSNYLSKDRREYLKKGGISFFIGDGWLNYRPEQIAESYYSINVAKGVWLSLDYQRVRNPAYNADRGPVNIVGARFNAEL